KENDYHGARRSGAVPANVYADWLRRAAAGISRGVLSLFESDADRSPSRRRDVGAFFRFAAACAYRSVGRRGGHAAGEDLPEADAAGPGEAVQRVREIASYTPADSEYAQWPRAARRAGCDWPALRHERDV